MIGIILARLSSAVPILLIVSLITFAMMHLIPGDPAVDDRGRERHAGADPGAAAPRPRPR